jgi:hypothetical protein
VCTQRNKLAQLASKLDSNTGQHHWPAQLASTINTTDQQHRPSPLVSTTGRHHWPRPLATCSKHVDDDDADDHDDDDEDDDDDDDDDYNAECDYDDDVDGDGDDGDGDDEFKIHVSTCVHECARRAIDLPSWPANWTAPLGSTTGQHHWSALFTPLANSTGRHH